MIKDHRCKWSMRPSRPDIHSIDDVRKPKPRRQNTILLDHYEEDYQKVDLQFPLRYLLWDAKYSLNLFFELPNIVEPAVFKRNLLYHKLNCVKDEPRFGDDVLKVYSNKDRSRDDAANSAVDSNTSSC